MELPFSIEQFFAVFSHYNRDVWPMQLIWNAIAIACIFLIAVKSKAGNKFVSASLALLWLWMGLVYHLGYFIKINSAALLFAVCFVLQAFLFFWFGFVRNLLHIQINTPSRVAASIVLIVYALVVYPLLNSFFGQHFPAAPTFGVPCPTTIFTIGLLCLMKDAPRSIFLVPVLWSVVGTFGALLLRVPADFGLPVAGVLTIVLFFDSIVSTPAIQPQPTFRTKV